MSIASHIRRPATLHTWSQDPDRDPVSGDYPDPTFADSEVRVEVQQQTTRERREGELVVTQEWVGLVRPPGVLYGADALKAQDEVTVPPLGRFAIEGDPYLVLRPSTQQATHWFARLRKVG